MKRRAAQPGHRGRFVRCTAVVLVAVITGCDSPQPMRLLTDEERATPATLSVGDPAPWVGSVEWIRGDPLTGFEPGQVVVIDLWAPWCGPCLAGFPHLQAVEAAHGGRVAVVALAMTGGSTRDEIRRTASEHASVMPSRVAIDTEGAAVEGYLVALRELAVPRTFVIDGSGRLAWYGHPIEVDEPLAAIVAGTWDLDAARRVDQERSQDRLISRAAVRDYLKAVEAGDSTEAMTAALAAVEKVCAIPIDHGDGMSPPWWAWHARVRLLIAAGRSSEALSAAREAAALDGIDDEPLAISDLARMVAPVDAGLGCELADRALELIRHIESDPSPNPWRVYLRDASFGGHSAAMLDIAAAFFTCDRVDAAIELQREALARWPDDPRLRPTKAELRATLERYEDAAR